MAHPQPIRRGLTILGIAMALTVAIVLIVRFFDQASPTARSEAEAADVPVVPTGFSTDTIVSEITAQAGKNLGSAVTVTCPPRIELKRDATITCQMAQAEGELAGTPLPDILVTITDPAAAQGAKYRWKQITEAAAP